MKSPRLHYLALASILLLGLGLRFWGLDSKPLWLDEVLTALFSSGLNYDNIPKQQAFSILELSQILAYQPQASCAQIAANLAQQSNHPPLLFCSLHTWLGWLQGLPMSLAWKLRSLPALWGVLAIGLTYALNRVAFSPSAGLMGAGLMAVSPFGLYLSQEARHYTLPVCLILLALALMVLLLQGLQKYQRLQLPLLLAWVVVNGLGLYTHYFFLYAFVAQILGLLVWLLRQRHLWSYRQISGLGLAALAVGCLYTPGLLTLVSYADNSETQWLALRTETWSDWLSPLLRLLMLMLTMVSTVPLESQPFLQVLPLLVIAVPLLLLSVWWAGRGIKQLGQNPDTAMGSQFLLGFTLGAIGLNLITIYVLRRDLSMGGRYSFIYFPGMITLLAAGLMARKPRLRHWQRSVSIGLGLFGTVFVLANQAFLKPFEPDKISTRLFNISQTLVTPELRSTGQNLVPNSASSPPILVAVAYHSQLRKITGLSYALEMAKLKQTPAAPLPAISFAFLDALQPSPNLNQQLLQVSQQVQTPYILWLVGQEPPDQPNLSQVEIGQMLKQQACKPVEADRFMASQGTIFCPYRCLYR